MKKCFKLRDVIYERPPNKNEEFKKVGFKVANIQSTRERESERERECVRGSGIYAWFCQLGKDLSYIREKGF